MKAGTSECQGIRLFHVKNGLTCIPRFVGATHVRDQTMIFTFNSFIAQKVSKEQVQ